MSSASGNLTLETYLNPVDMKAALQQGLPIFSDAQQIIEDVRVVKVLRNASIRRNPSPMTLCYELKIRNPHTGLRRPLNLFGKVFRDTQSAQAEQAQGAYLLASLNLLIWIWPLDPGLPQLRRLLVPSATQAYWGAAARHVRAVRYVPERRATLCFSREHRDPDKRQLFAKTFADSTGALVFERFRHFWDISLGNSDAPLVAKPLAYCIDTQSVWQESASGSPIETTMHGPQANLFAQRLARAIATLHSAPIHLAGANVRDQAHWVKEVQRRVNKISRAVPELSQRTGRIAGILVNSLRALAEYQPCLIHGDFHPDQVWTQGERILFFDFDEFAKGDPMEDLASFMTKIEPNGPTSIFSALLVNAYEKHAPEHFNAWRLHWHLGLQQLLQASRAFAFQKASWRSELVSRLSRAEAILSALEVKLQA